MLRALAFALVLLSFGALSVGRARAQDSCVRPRSTRCSVLPGQRTIPRLRPASPHVPARGTPSDRAAVALDRAWNLAEALPPHGAEDAVRLARDALAAVLAEHAHVDGLELGNIRAEWPTEFAIQLTVAELSWRLEDLDACATHFERLVRRYPDSDYREDAAYAALLCHNRIVQSATSTHTAPMRSRRGRRGQSDDDLPDPEDLTAEQQEFVNAADRYVCVHSGNDDGVMVAYRAARVFYEANRYEEAASRFRVIADRYPSSDLAEYAANLYLDSLNMLARERPECGMEMTDAVDRLRPIYCGTSAAQDRHPDLCGVIMQVACDVSTREAEMLSAGGAHLAARDRYIRIARTQRECGRLDEVLYNAMRAAQAGGDGAGAARIRSVLRRNFPQSHLANAP